jgi:ferredoxin-NADP reductase
MLGDDFIKVITGEKVPGIYHRRIDKEYLKSVVKEFNQHFYICGPEPFTEAVKNSLIELGASVDEVIIEK